MSAIRISEGISNKNLLSGDVKLSTSLVREPDGVVEYELNEREEVCGFHLIRQDARLHSSKLPTFKQN